MFHKVLIANRGEIAVRVIRACRELGVRTVLAYSEVDRRSLPVRLADEVVCVGPPPATKSYLNIPNIISAALLSGCDAIHPGYGFLAENTYVADICEQYGITFIGPPPTVIEKTGDKALARKLMAEAGLPVIPGPCEPLRSVGEAREAAEEIGFPVILKAALGGGGKGMRVVYQAADLPSAYTVAQAEAEGAFGRADLYLEKYLARPRHVEVQLLGDGQGKVLHLGERDCSLQRRYQKILEESPCPALSLATRQAIWNAAVRGATSIGYANAGTMEFLMDSSGQFYFIEMNARIQVEHPVTEMVTGIDLVKWQLRLAAGEPLTLSQEEITMKGHALECRINAEDTKRGFEPISGQVKAYLPPGGPGVRVDSHLFAGYSMPPFYDSLLAKLVVWGISREEALERMQRALGEFVMEGLATTIGFHQRVLEHPAFRRGDVHVGFIEEEMLEDVAQPVLGT